MDTGQCQTNEVNKFVNRAEKSALSSRKNTPSFRTIRSIRDRPRTFNDRIEQKFLQHPGGFNRPYSYMNVHPRTLEDQNLELTALKSNDNKTSWVKDFRYNHSKDIELPIENQLTNLNLGKELHKPKMGLNPCFYSSKTFSMPSFPLIDHEVPKTRSLKLPVSSHIDSLINAEFLEMEGSSFNEEIHVEEKSSVGELENEEAVIKDLASDMVEFCSNNSVDADIKERLNSSKFMGLMGDISDGSIILKKEEDKERNLQKHVGFCFEGTGSWAGLEFHNVKDRISQ